MCSSDLENVNSLLARYETVRQRAALEGQFVMTVPGCSLQIIRACGMGPQHLFILLQPFQGKLPQTDAQFRELCTQLRRYGHIVENAPGNIGNQLTGAPRQARPGAYLAQSMGAYLTQSGSTLDTATFLSGAQDGQAGNSADPLSQSLLQQQHDPFASWQQDGTCGEHSLDAYHAAARSAGSANPFVSAMPPDLTGTYQGRNCL